MRQTGANRKVNSRVGSFSAPLILCRSAKPVPVHDAASDTHILYGVIIRRQKCHKATRCNPLNRCLSLSLASLRSTELYVQRCNYRVTRLHLRRVRRRLAFFNPFSDSPFDVIHAPP